MWKPSAEVAQTFWTQHAPVTNWMYEFRCFGTILPVTLKETYTSCHYCCIAFQKSRPEDDGFWEERPVTHLGGSVAYFEAMGGYQ